MAVRDTERDETAAELATATLTTDRGIRRGGDVRRWTRTRRSGAGVWWWVGGLLLAALFLLPLVTTLTGSLKSPEELRQRPPTLLPTEISFDAWERMFDPGEGVLRGILNSLVVAGGTVALAVALSVLAGYGLARYRFRGSGVVFAVILAGMMIPFTVLLTPISVVLRELGLFNSLLGVVLVYTTYQLPFCVFIMRNSFAAIPDEIEEASLIDGCTRWTSLLRVFLPLVVPGIVTSAIFAFLNAWNEFLAALVLLTDQNKFTLPVVLQSNQIGRFGTVDWGLLDAGVVVSMVPCLIIFFLLQRHYVNGIFAGAAK
ncbi:carbohydrate ABC transporter permease [Microbacterium sp. NPDC055910]|uniref:carbohydrate ABC transporter permease n=1 Tax=Microbacterium sp. NPDC055910 TaxID=3345659 RepID=UPI0035E21A78